MTGICLLYTEKNRYIYLSLYVSISIHNSMYIYRDTIFQIDINIEIKMICL